MGLWAAIGEQSINLTEIRGAISRKLALLAETSVLWGSLGKYLRFQQRWRYIFLNYSFFLLNQRLPYKDAEELRNLTEDTCFLGESICLAPTDPSDRLYSKGLLFDKKAFYLRAKMEAGMLQILAVSQSFQTFTDYPPAEVVGSPVHLLMPE